MVIKEFMKRNDFMKIYNTNGELKFLKKSRDVFMSKKVRSKVFFLQNFMISNLRKIAIYHSWLEV